MVSLYFMYYNFGRVHQTLRVTPAMEAGIASRVWTIDEIVGLLGEPDAARLGVVAFRLAGARRPPPIPDL